MVADKGYVVGKGNARQTCAVAESKGVDRGYAVGNRNACQTEACRERTKTDRGDAGGQGNAYYAAVAERIFADFRYGQILMGRGDNHVFIRAGAYPDNRISAAVGG